MFGYDYVCAGDWNGDAFDDLIFANEPYLWGIGDTVVHVNRIEFYLGSRDGLRDSAAVLFQDTSHTWTLGWRLQSFGNVIEGRDPLIGYQSMLWVRGQMFPRYSATQIYEGGEHFTGEPVMRKQVNYRPGTFFSWGYESRPTDLNGDGHKDVVALYTSRDMADNFAAIEIYFGGDSLPSISDWRAGVEAWNFSAETAHISTGRDINGDGFDDLLVLVLDRQAHTSIYLFLGGNPMPTEPLFHFRSTSFEGKFLARSAALLGDVNNDGYDDWAFSYIDQNDVSGYLLFYGGAEPDSIPDLELEGYTGGFDLENAPITSGDFNGDGVDDIVASCWHANIMSGDVKLWFGSRWLSSAPDIDINPEVACGDNYYGVGEALGAVGDFDGDGADDFVVRKHPTDFHDVVIVSGNREWRVNVQSTGVVSSPYSTSLDASPIPFNSSLKIDITTPSWAQPSLQVFDIQGRMVVDISCEINGGKKSVTWAPRGISSGIYLVRLSLPNQPHQHSLIRKVVYLP